MDRDADMFEWAEIGDHEIPEGPPSLQQGAAEVLDAQGSDIDPATQQDVLSEYYVANHRIWYAFDDDEDPYPPDTIHHRRIATAVQYYEDNHILCPMTFLPSRDTLEIFKHSSIMARVCGITLSDEVRLSIALYESMLLLRGFIKDHKYHDNHWLLPAGLNKQELFYVAEGRDGSHVLHSIFTRFSQCRHLRPIDEDEIQVEHSPVQYYSYPHEQHLRFLFAIVAAVDVEIQPLAPGTSIQFLECATERMTSLRKWLVQFLVQKNPDSPVTVQNLLSQPIYLSDRDSFRFNPQALDELNRGYRLPEWVKQGLWILHEKCSKKFPLDHLGQKKVNGQWPTAAVSDFIAVMDTDGGPLAISPSMGEAIPLASGGGATLTHSYQADSYWHTGADIDEDGVMQRVDHSTEFPLSRDQGRTSFLDDFRKNELYYLVRIFGPFHTKVLRGGNFTYVAPPSNQEFTRSIAPSLEMPELPQSWKMSDADAAKYSRGTKEQEMAEKIHRERVDKRARDRQKAQQKKGEAAASAKAGTIDTPVAGSSVSKRDDSHKISSTLQKAKDVSTPTPLPVSQFAGSGQSALKRGGSPKVSPTLKKAKDASTPTPLAAVAKPSNTHHNWVSSKVNSKGSIFRPIPGPSQPNQNPQSTQLIKPIPVTDIDLRDRADEMLRNTLQDFYDENSDKDQKQLHTIFTEVVGNFYESLPSLAPQDEEEEEEVVEEVGWEGVINGEGGVI